MLKFKTNELCEKCFLLKCPVSVKILAGCFRKNHGGPICNQSPVTSLAKIRLTVPSQI